MGTRGSSSHRGGGGSILPGRIGRDQLSPWRNNATALQQILRDTGYTLADAQLAQMTQIRYYGADYDAFTEGSLPHETEIISEALMRMPYYNGGSIYRGISVPDRVADSVFLDTWKPGTVHYFTDKLGHGNAVVQSFPVTRTLPNHSEAGIGCRGALLQSNSSWTITRPLRVSSTSRSLVPAKLKSCFRPFSMFTSTVSFRCLIHLAAAGVLKFT